MLRRLYLVITLAIMTFSVFAMNINFLITVDTEKASDTNALKKLDLQIYHVSGNVLIAGISELDKIVESNIPYSIIDEKAWTEKYYLISHKKGDLITTDPAWGIEIYRDDNVVIIKTLALSLDQISIIPYSITELYPISIKYRYEKVYPSMRSQLPAQRTDIDQLLSEINPDSLGYFIQSLENFGTRYCYAANRDQVANWIKNEFLRFGYTDVVIDSFYQNNVWHKNVVTTIPGTLNPDQIVIIGGHHDSISSGNPMVTAPGADDNGTGTGAAMEIARALKAIDFEPETTIRFITFAAEEVGLWGSHHYAQSAVDEGMNIKIMLNNDMIGHTTQGPNNWTIHLIEYNGYENEANFSRQVMQQFTNMTPVTYSYNSPSSDSYPFWIRGFPPIFFIETEFSPYYHTPNDLFIHLNMDYAVETVRATAAIGVLINSVPDIPSDFVAIDAGNGSELILQWTPVTSTVIDHYEISVGLSTGNYTTFFETEESTLTLSGLNEGVTYYVGISAVGASGFASSIIETTGTPRSIPLSPLNLTDTPEPDRINLTWSPNLEADLAGYRLYRSETLGEMGELLNQNLLTSNNFTDPDVEAGVYYYYTLTAVDESQNESDPSEQVRSRIVSMDQGVLIVADTQNGSGAFQNPTLESVTQYYNNILYGFYPDIFPLWSEDRVKLADLGAYSTVIWHRNNVSVSLYSAETINTIKQYLDAGGNILFSVYFPGSVFGNSNSYPTHYNQGSFLYDYLKINMIDMNSTARFISAQPIDQNYPAMMVDANKAPAGLNYHIFNIESIQANQEGNDVYYYHSAYPSGSPETAMNGMPVGVEYLGTDYKVITLSFPLYYMEAADARDFITYVMSEKFFEPMSIDDDLTLPMTGKKFHLYANYPNPFNPETVIKYTVSNDSQVNLTVYNLKGQRVKTLVNDKVLPGEHLTVWNGKDDSGREVASGIYFYQLTTDFGQDVKKMILMK